MAATRWVGRPIGLDVHRNFCVVAIRENGEVRAAGRVPSSPRGLGMLAQSLLRSDRVALEVTGSCWEVARILEPHVERVVVVSPDDTGITQARAKTDRLDARTLARLLWRGSWSRSGCGTSAAGCCVGGSRVASSWCAHARALRTRSTRCCSAACRANRRARTCSASRAAGGSRVWSTNLAIRQAERRLAEQAEVSYKRMVKDQQAGAPARRVGASATPERA
jgi:hypothetical protein